MKNFIRSAIFISGIVIMLIIGSLLLAPKNSIYNASEFSKKTAELSKEPDNSIDVVIVGDSAVYSSYNPIEINENAGFTTFLLSTYAQRLCDSYALLEQMYKTQSPKIIVMETNCFFRFGGLSDETSDKFLNFMMHYIPAMKYHSKLKMLILKPDNTSDAGAKGYVHRTGVNPYTGGEWMIPTDATEDIIPINVNYLDKIRDLAEKHGSTLIFITTPSPECQTYERHNGVLKYAEKYDIDYYDFNLVHKDIGIDWSLDTLDSGNHLNNKGAKKVSGYFAKVIMNNYALPNHP